MTMSQYANAIEANYSSGDIDGIILFVLGMLKANPGLILLCFGFLFTLILSYGFGAEIHDYTTDEVAKHNKKEDCWVIVDGAVYDVTNFIRKHPPGGAIILKYAGKDVSEHFKYHLLSTQHFWRQLKIGQVVKMVARTTKNEYKH